MEINVKLLPPQLAFLRSTAKEVLYSGAFGAGKSRGLCYKAVEGAVIPGNQVGLCRKKFADVRATTLRVLLEPEGDLPPVLPRGTYTHNKTEHLIRVKGGGTIYYFGFDEELRIGSFNFGRVCIDEGIELDLEEYLMLLGRARNKADPYRQVCVATNPGAPTHFLHHRFFPEEHGEGPLPSTREVIRTTAHQNFFLPADYIALLDTFEGQAYQRWVCGNWVTVEGLVYPSFDPDLHVVSIAPIRWRRVVCGVDAGYTHPAVCLWGGVHHDDHVHIFEEWHGTGKLDSEVAKQAATIETEIYLVDPSAPKLIAEMRRAPHYLAARGGENPIETGVQVVRDYLRLDATGTPLLTIDPACSLLRSEFTCYKLHKQTEKPEDAHNHALDALRYMLMELAEHRAVGIKWLGGTPTVARGDHLDPDRGKIMQRRAAWAGV